MFGYAFVKAQPTTYLLQYRGGKVVREGAGLSFFYYRPFSTVAAVPVGSRDAPFIFELVTHDFQAVTVQGQVAFRVEEPRKAAGMLDFALKPDGTIDQMKMAAVSPLCDFSFDYQDLLFRPVAAGKD